MRGAKCFSGMRGDFVCICLIEARETLSIEKQFQIPDNSNVHKRYSKLAAFTRNAACLPMVLVLIIVNIGLHALDAPITIMFLRSCVRRKA